MLGINPGSEQVRYTPERDGLIDTFKKFESTRIFTMQSLWTLYWTVGQRRLKKRKKFYCSFFF